MSMDLGQLVLSALLIPQLNKNNSPEKEVSDLLVCQSPLQEEPCQRAGVVGLKLEGLL